MSKLLAVFDAGIMTVTAYPTNGSLMIIEAFRDVL